MAILGGQVLINGVDIYNIYGAFLGEEKKGDRKNQKSIFTPSKTKEHVAVNFREKNGEKHAEKLVVANEPRDVELTFCIYAPTKSKWLEQYDAFVKFLKMGVNGWLAVEFPTIDLELKMFYLSCSSYAPITYIWNEGVQASHFKVKFREPIPIF